MALNLSALFPGGFTAAELTAPSVTTLITGPSSTITATTAGTARLRLGPDTLATVTPR